MAKASDDIREGYGATCFSERVEPDTQEEPELATNEEWRGIMVRARKEHGFSQESLGQKLGVSQALISKMESGEVGSSKLVMPICRLLGIPAPEHFVDEEEKNWVRLGRVLRHRNPEQAKVALQLVESMVRQYESELDEVPTPAPPSKPKRDQG